MAEVKDLLYEAITSAKENVDEVADVDAQFEMFNITFTEAFAAALKAHSIHGYAVSVRNGSEINLSGLVQVMVRGS